MAYDAGLAELMEADLADEPGITRQKMFGGLAFLRDGHMVCGLHRGGAMYRVGKDGVEAALALPGISRVEMGTRVMGGMIGADDEVMADDDRRGALLALALAHVRTLPPK